jgi:signal transduction histidine kinase
MHGGKAWVEDAQPAGALFVVELPLAPDSLPSSPLDDHA